MTGIYARAVELETLIRAAVTAAEGLDLVTVTLDGLKVPSAARNGVVVIVPPRVELTTFTQYDAEWTVLIVAGPIDRLDVAWQRLDGILAAVLASELPFEVAEPDTYVTAQQSRIPCIALTFTETIHPA